jgi:anti-sigma factor RsiW
MTCQELAGLVTEYAEGGLSLLDRLRLELHLGACRDCRAYLRQMRAVARALGKLPPPEVPPGVEEELLRRFDRWSRG